MQERGDFPAGPPPGPVGRPLPPAPPPPPRSYWWVAIVGAAFVVALVAAVVAIAQVAGDGDASVPAPSPTTAPATAPPLPVGTAPAPPAGGVRFDDPDGRYSLTIDPHWVDITASVAEGTEAWAVGPVTGGFTANVNVVTDDARGLGLDAYVRASVATLQENGANVMEITEVAAEPGATLATMRYAATPAGSSRRLEFAAVLAGGNGHVAIATLTAPAAGFDEVAAEVVPYLLTLRARG